MTDFKQFFKPEILISQKIFIALDMIYLDYEIQVIMYSFTQVLNIDTYLTWQGLLCLIQVLWEFELPNRDMWVVPLSLSLSRLLLASSRWSWPSCGGPVTPDDDRFLLAALSDLGNASSTFLEAGWGCNKTLLIYHQ